MSGHFWRLVEEAGSSGLIIVPQDLALGVAIEQIVLIWVASEPAEWRDQVEYLPL